MSTEREYIVTLRDKNDATDFITQMTESSSTPETIPDRSVTIVNERLFSDRNTHYALTDAEAEQLRQDSRVLAVELLPEERGFEKVNLGKQGGQNFHRDEVTINNTMRNWGLYRHTQVSAGYVGSQITGDYTYSQDGTGVDLVVVDSGIFPGHPEWSSTYDGTGPSRLQQIDWHAVTGVPGSQAPAGGYYMDLDGHGSNCASLAAGSQNGFAKGANIYSIRIFGGYVNGVYYGEISDAIVFDIVKAFHLQKPVNAKGYRRPTVCTNSWGWRSIYPSGSITTNWRGTSYVHSGRNSTYGQVSSYHGVRIPSLDADVQDCVDAGVICLGAAGNYYHKIDSVGGVDYDNYYDASVHYHRGSSPAAQDAGMIVVGALDNTNTEQKATFSETGPGVDIYGAGVMTMAAYSNDSYHTPAVQDARASGFYLNKLSGTSMATPNVAGIACLMAGMRPKYTTANIKQWLIELSDKNTMTEGTNTYTNTRHLQGGSQRVVKWPYKAERPFEATNLVPANGAKLGL